MRGLEKRARLCSVFGYFVNYKRLSQKNRKYFLNRQRNCSNRGKRKELQKSAHIFLEQPFKCVKIIFSQIILKTGRRTTQTRNGTAISNFHEYRAVTKALIRGGGGGTYSYNRARRSARRISFEINYNGNFSYGPARIFRIFYSFLFV